MGTMLHFHLNLRTTLQDTSNFIDANFTILSGQIMLLTFHICVDNWEAPQKKYHIFNAVSNWTKADKFAPESELISLLHIGCSVFPK